jgi:hypothetical protein
MRQAFHARAVLRPKAVAKRHPVGDGRRNTIIPRSRHPYLQAVSFARLSRGVTEATLLAGPGAPEDKVPFAPEAFCTEEHIEISDDSATREDRPLGMYGRPRPAVTASIPGRYVR